MAKRLALFFGLVFVAVGLLGYLPNDIVGPRGLFLTNGTHNLVHLLFGAILLIASAAINPATAALWLDILGTIYLALAVIGFLMIGHTGAGWMFGMVHFNGSDNWLHLFLGIALLAAGLSTRARQTVVTAR